MSDRIIERWGKSFELADSVGLMPWMRFAHAAKKGIDSSDIEAMDAMYTMLEACFTEKGWDDFQSAAMANMASGDDLFAAVIDAVKAISEARPTTRPSDSSDGSPTTSVNSAGGSSSPAIDRLIERGRPDLALVVTQAQEYRASA